MNDDLISRKAFYEDFRNIPRLGGMAIVESENVALAIERAPAINAEPKRGCWIEDDYAYNRCSECGYEYDHPEEKSPYCPNCGANMDLENEK